MRQIKEELRNINESLQTIECALAEIEPELEEAQYWKWEHTNFPITKGTVIRISVVNETTVTYRAIDGSVSGNCGIESLRQNARLLSDDEVEQALIEEFKERYDIGDVVEHWLHPVLNNGRKDQRDIPDIKDFEYSSTNDVLTVYYGDGGGEFLRIYKEGDWAEIIDDEWEVVNRTETHSFVHTDNLVVDMSGKRCMTQKEAIEIRDALNNMED